MTTKSRKALLPVLKDLHAKASKSQWKSLVDFFGMALDNGEDPSGSTPNMLDDRVEDVAKSMGKCEFERVKGVSLGGQVVYPVAEFGWDEGVSVDTTLWNLKELASSDIYGGATASICVAKDPSLPAFAVHWGQDFVVLQVFG
jgi:hypothetical protein